MTATTSNQRLQDWVSDWTAILQPATTHWCDGSDEEFERLCRLLVEHGTFTPLSAERRPNSFLALSDPSDVARVEDRTYICTTQEIDAGPTNNWREPAEMRAELVDSEKMTGGARPSAGGRVSSVPINGIPNRGQIMMLGILAAAIGSVVASNYRPFAARGFANVGRLATLLRIPVVATLPITAGSALTDLHNQRFGLPWANWFVHGAKAVLFGLLLLVVGFCLINQEVRQAFLENPFHGFAKMVWVFVGY